MKTDFEIDKRVILDRIAAQELYLDDLSFERAESDEALNRIMTLRNKVMRTIKDRIDHLFELANIGDAQVEPAFAYIDAQKERMMFDRFERTRMFKAYRRAA